MNLAGQTALVTGGAKRIGRAICETLADAGCPVIVHYGTSEAEAEATANDLRDRGVEAWTVRANLLEIKEAESLVGAAAEAAGRPIDLLVNNASAFPQQKWATATYGDVDHMMRIHAWAPFAATRALAAQGGKAVVNLLDTRITADDPAHGPYLLSKQALWHMTQDMARQFAPVRVNGVAPGPILTPTDGSGDASMQAAIEATVLGRMGTPHEIAHAVRFLLEADYVTGDVVFVDGGRHLRD